MCLAATTELADKDPKDVRVLVVGPTGYIGKFVVKELLKRGYTTVAFAREKSGVGGKASKQQTSQACTLPVLEFVAFPQDINLISFGSKAINWYPLAQEFGGADVRFGNVGDLQSLQTVAFRDHFDVVVSCLASRTGGKVGQT